MTTKVSRPLDGMLVLDLGQIYNGPYCGLLLGFMGARVLKIESLVEPGVWVDVEHPRRGKTRVPISPIRLHGCAPAIVKRPTPLLGEDTDRVLSDLLGLAADELATLRAAGVTEPVTT